MRVIKVWSSIMNEDLEQLWGKLSLTEEEQIEVVLERDWLAEVNEVGKNSHW